MTCNFKTAIWISFWYSYISSFKVKKVRKQFWGSSFSIRNKHIKNGPQFSFDKYWVFFWSCFLKAKQNFCKNFIKLCKYLVRWSENFMPIKNPPFGLIVHRSYSWMAFRTTNNTRTEVNNRLCYTLFLIGKQLFKPARLV